MLALNLDARQSLLMDARSNKYNKCRSAQRNSKNVRVDHRCRFPKIRQLPYVVPLFLMNDTTLLFRGLWNLRKVLRHPGTMYFFNCFIFSFITDAVGQGTLTHVKRAHLHTQW